MKKDLLDTLKTLGNKMVLLLVIFSLIISNVSCQSKVVQSEDGTAGTIKFSTPNLDDDDAHSPWMPDTLKCDACRAVAFCVSSNYAIKSSLKLV